MADYKNAGRLRNAASLVGAAALNFNKFEFNIAAGKDRPAVVPAINDRIQIGVVPAGEKLCPHLCFLSVPQLDSAGTGAASVGITGTPAAIKALAVVTAAALYTGEDFALLTGEVGSADEETPIYLVFTTAVTTMPAAGIIAFHQVTRAIDARNAET